MTPALYALIGFVFWSVALFFAIAGWRVSMVLSGESTASGFTAGQPHGSDMYWRLNRAHANCLENIPLFAAVALTGAVVGLDSSTFDTCARVYMAARVGQSVTHIASGSELAVNVRFGFYLAQIGCLITMALALV